MIMRSLELWWQQSILEDRWRGWNSAHRLVEKVHSIVDLSRSESWLSPLPTISVGSPFLGGSGKTPLTAAIGTLVEEMGFQLGIVSRGYRRKSAGQLVVCAGTGLCVSPERAGDELALIARRLPTAVIVADADRRRGILKAQALGAQVVCLDDGFQHRRVTRDLDLVVMQAEELQHPHRLFPFGRLREPISCMQRAQALVVIAPPAQLAGASNASASDCLGPLPAWIPASLPVLLARIAATGWQDAHSHAPVDCPRSVAAFSSIARPHRFFSLVEQRGIQLTGRWIEADHRAPRGPKFEQWIAEQKARGALALVCTEKDAMHSLPSLGLPVLYLAIELDWGAHQEQLARLVKEHLNVAIARH
jgi:tetraacyldisaccharide 4'-kinase